MSDQKAESSNPLQEFVDKKYNGMEVKPKTVERDYFKEAIEIAQGGNETPKKEHIYAMAHRIIEMGKRVEQLDAICRRALSAAHEDRKKRGLGLILPPHLRGPVKA